jgi:hypothetical protein
MTAERANNFSNSNLHTGFFLHVFSLTAVLLLSVILLGQLR